MCGICCCLFLISGNSRRLNKIIEDSILPHLQRRGPDHVGKKEYFAEKVQGKLHLTLVGTVLHLRGDKTPQPLEDEHGNVLLWNGEIFGGIQVEETENDSLVLLKALGCCPLELSPSQHVLSTMAKLQGPWAFVYWQASEQKLWFGRDYFGRRSLLWHLPSNSEDILTITSVAERNSTEHHQNLTMEEIPADGLYCVDVSNDEVNERTDQPLRIDKYEWRTAEDMPNNDSVMSLTCPVTPFNRQMPSPQDLPLIDENRRRLCLQKNETTNAHTKEVKATTEDCEKSVEKGKSLDEGGGNVSKMGVLCGEDVESLQERNETGNSTLFQSDLERTGSENSSNAFNSLQGNASSSSSDITPLVLPRSENDIETGNYTFLQSDLERTGSKHSFAACNSLQDEAFSSSSDITPPVLPRSENDETLTLELTATDSQVNEQSGCRELSRCLEFTPTSASNLAFCESVENGELSKHNKIASSVLIPQESAVLESLTTQWSSVYRTSQDAFISVLGEAVRKRVFNLPRSENNSHSEFSSRDTCPVSLTNDTASVAQNFSALTVKKKDARVGILFSGGIDSMMIAALADRFVPSEEAIDLINVAFEQKPQTPNLQNKKKGKNKGKQSRTEGSSAVERERDFNVPDRVTGISGLRELQSINPLRQWNFIEVDVTIEELQEMRSRHISHLVSPLNTVLDDSIGCALWFAARGRGCLRSSAISGGVGEVVNANGEDKAYTSTAKVLLVGMGADEQLGGYARHRTRFNNEGWSGLMQEMEMEVRRISKRNLGRDDRCISDHGREARFPFLDEEVVSFLNSLPVWVKTDPSLPRGTGEKLLLRQAARLLGLTSSSELPKRAIQFGSRIAKLESAGEKGFEACSRLKF